MKKETTLTELSGKIPPQAIDIEVAVLGAILLEKNALAEAVDHLHEDSFYLDAHRAVWRAVRRLDLKNSAIDMLTVVEELNGVKELELAGGPYGVTKLTNSVVSSANITDHAKIVAQKYMLRAMISAGMQMALRAYEPEADPFELLDQAEAALTAIHNQNQRSKFVTMEQAVMKSAAYIEAIRGVEGGMTGVPSGYPSLDKITHGWQPSDLIILAARPAVGKTAFALNLARNPAQNNNVPVAFFSLEMSIDQLTQRALSAESGVWLEKIKTGNLDDDEYRALYQRGIAKLAQAPIYLDDTAGLNVFELRAKARRLKNKFNIGMIIIDYLQLMSGTGGKNSNREQEISNISRNLKVLAKELMIPIIALSQLSRAVETRKEGNKMPQLSDLRESGAIEQDADMVMFLYRPEYYDITSNEMGESNKGETHVRIAKHRSGSLETIKLCAQLHIQKFVEMEEDVPGSWQPKNDNHVRQSTWTPYKDNDDDRI